MSVEARHRPLTTSAALFALFLTGLWSGLGIAIKFRAGGCASATSWVGSARARGADRPGVGAVDKGGPRPEAGGGARAARRGRHVLPRARDHEHRAREDHCQPRRRRPLHILGVDGRVRPLPGPRRPAHAAEAAGCTGLLSGIVVIFVQGLAISADLLVGDLLILASALVLAEHQVYSARAAGRIHIARLVLARLALGDGRVRGGKRASGTRCMVLDAAPGASLFSRGGRRLPVSSPTCGC